MSYTLALHTVSLFALWVPVSWVHGFRGFLQEHEVTVNCHNTGDKATIQWTPYSKAKERYRELNGKVVDSLGEVQYLLHGAWDKGMTRKKPGEIRGD